MTASWDGKVFTSVELEGPDSDFQTWSLKDKIFENKRTLMFLSLKSMNGGVEVRERIISNKKNEEKKLQSWDILAIDDLTTTTTKKILTILDGIYYLDT